MRQGCLSPGGIQCANCHCIIPHSERYLAIDEENGVEVEKGGVSVNAGVCEGGTCIVSVICLIAPSWVSGARLHAFSQCTNVAVLKASARRKNIRRDTISTFAVVFIHHLSHYRVQYQT